MSENKKYEFKQVDVRLCLKDATPYLSDKPIDNTDKAVALMTEILKDMDREYFCVINLDAGLCPINYSIVSIGTNNKAMVSPSNVFKSAILSNATAIIAIHNHPSGNPTPSQADLSVTERLVAAGKLLDIKCMDHVVIGQGNSLSIAAAYPNLFTGEGLNAGVAECNANNMRAFAI